MRRTGLNLTAADALIYLKDAVPELQRLTEKLRENPTSIERRDRVLDKNDAISAWLTTFRRAVVEGKLG